MVRLAVENAVDTLHWLFDLGYQLDPTTPTIFLGHEPYRVARTHYATDKGREILRVLRPVVERLVRQGKITLLLNHEMTGFAVSDERDIDAVVANGRTFVGRNYVLTTGGYAASRELFPKYTGGYPLFGRAYPHSRGTGIDLALRLGASLRGGEYFVPGFAAIEHPTEPGRYYTFTCTTPQVRQPWEIYVATDGRRFLAEDTPSVDDREHVLLKRPDLTFWAIYDQRIADEAPWFFDNGIVARLSPEEVANAFATRHPSFVEAATLRELAERTGLPPDALGETIAEYNRAVAAGRDPLGRTHLPRAIERPPYFAVKHGGLSVVSFAGLVVDRSLRVLRGETKPIPRLYAAGEALGFALLNGGSYCSGMGITPALTFGRLLGQRILHWRAGGEAAGRTTTG
jgi:fumarate reductase flavoprotein subunit